MSSTGVRGDSGGAGDSGLAPARCPHRQRALEVSRVPARRGGVAPRRDDRGEPGCRHRGSTSIVLFAVLCWVGSQVLTRLRYGHWRSSATRGIARMPAFDGNE